MVRVAMLFCVSLWALLADCSEMPCCAACEPLAVLGTFVVAQSCQAHKEREL